MPLLRQASSTPSLERVEQAGVRVVDVCPEATSPLHIGLLNMMPDRALLATERQFFTLLDSHNTRCCTVSLFSIDGIPREDEATLKHVRTHYAPASTIDETDLDALIITGANVTEADLTQEIFWEELANVLTHADGRPLPVLCSCLAAHASALVFHNIQRQHLPRKCWGIFGHTLQDPHPLLSGLPEHIDMPHSRFNEIPEDALRQCGVQILIAGDCGVQMAVEADGRRLYFQGHPEYEAISLLKEYKREIIRYLMGEREDYPPVPENTFSSAALEQAENFRGHVLEHGREPELLEAFPEEALMGPEVTPWHDVARQIYRNWLGSLG